MLACYGHLCAVVGRLVNFYACLILIVRVLLGYVCVTKQNYSPVTHILSVSREAESVLELHK